MAITCKEKTFNCKVDDYRTWQMGRDCSPKELIVAYEKADAELKKYHDIVGILAERWELQSVAVYFKKLPDYKPEFQHLELSVAFPEFCQVEGDCRMLSVEAMFECEST